MKYKNINKKFKGGMTTDSDFEKAFYTFLHNSKITFFSNGASGLIFKCDLIDSFKDNSPYYSFKSSNYGEKVNSLIIKIIFVNELVNKKNKNDFSFQLNNSNITHENPSSFYDELSIQSEVCLKTIKYLEPITPVIVFSDILSNKDSLNFISIFRNNFKGDIRIIDYIEMLLSNFFIDKSSGNNNGPFNNYKSHPKLSMLGIIAMELLDTNYQSMFQYYYKNIHNYDSFDSRLKKYYEKRIDFSSLRSQIKFYKEKYTNEKNEETANKLKELFKILKKDENDIITLKTSIDKTINDINSKLNFDLYKNMARLNIINIAFYTGYSQADYHFKNILIDPNYIGYYKDNSQSIDTNTGSNTGSNKLVDIDINDNVNKNNSQSKFVFNTPTNNMSYFIDIKNSDSTDKNYYDKNSQINTNINDSNFDKLDKMVGGNDNLIDKGKVMIIDYGYSNFINPDQYTKLQEDFEYIYDNLDNIHIKYMKMSFNNMLDIIHETPRKDKVQLNKNLEAFYDWFVGKFFCSMCEGPAEFFRLQGITDNDVQIMINLIKSRQNAIDYLVSNVSKLNIPIELPLTDKYIRTKAFDLLNINYKPPIKGGGDNNINEIISNCFKSIGYGLVSINNVKEKIDKLYSKNLINVNKSYKMIDTENYMKPLAVGVMGGLKRKHTKKYKKNIKNIKNKSMNKRKSKHTKKNKTKYNRK
jgi:hypothetical protein